MNLLVEDKARGVSMNVTRIGTRNVPSVRVEVKNDRGTMVVDLAADEWVRFCQAGIALGK
jgi:hypothetical protein